MYLFRYRCQGATLRGASPQCLHDQGGFRRIPEDSRGLAAAGKPACSPWLGRKKGAPSRTCVNAVLHLQILSPRPIISSWIRFGIAWSGFGLRLAATAPRTTGAPSRAQPRIYSFGQTFARRSTRPRSDFVVWIDLPRASPSERPTRVVDPRTPR